MDEVTHELWYAGFHVYDYNIKTRKIKFKGRGWSTSSYLIKELENYGWKAIPVHVELENK